MHEITNQKKICFAGGSSELKDSDRFQVLFEIKGYLLLGTLYCIAKSRLFMCFPNHNWQWLWQIWKLSDKKYSTLWSEQHNELPAGPFHLHMNYIQVVNILILYLLEVHS